MDAGYESGKVSDFRVTFKKTRCFALRKEERESARYLFLSLLSTRLFIYHIAGLGGLIKPLFFFLSSLVSQTHCRVTEIFQKLCRRCTTCVQASVKLICAWRQAPVKLLQHIQASSDRSHLYLSSSNFCSSDSHRQWPTFGGYNG